MALMKVESSAFPVAHLPAPHHIRVPGNHDTVIVPFPVFLQRVTDQIRASL